MFYVSLFVFVFFLALSTMAEVKKEFGEFKTVHTEQLRNQPILQRHYSSRSLFKGVFGFNWCSQLDYKITVSDNEMSVFDCEAGKHIVFKKINVDRFHSVDLQNDLVVENGWIRFDRSPLTLYFSKDGRLSHWTASSSDSVHVIYKGNSATQLRTTKSGVLDVTYGKDGLVKSVGKSFSYEYNQGLLRAVLKDGKSIWRYQYDEFLNMTLWRGPSSSEEMKYDSEWDRIVYLKDKNDCRFRYQYELKDSKKFILESKKCLNSREKETLFEMISPRLLVKSPTDQLGKEFRQGANNETNF